MTRLLRFFAQGKVIAMRDFRAVVSTPTFILFLLAPIFMLGFGFIGGSGMASLSDGAPSTTRIAAIASPADGRALEAADQAMRAFGNAPMLEVVPSHDGKDGDVARSLLGSSKADYVAVMYGPLDRPVILRGSVAEREAAWLSALADRATLERQTGREPGSISAPAKVESIAAERAGIGVQRQIGMVAVVVVFVFTVLLAGQAVGMLAEEKSNKVIEIIAAAVPLEAVFLGKLVGMFGVALLFVGFWSGIAALALLVVPGDPAQLALLQPAIGLPGFIILAALYFAMAYMLLGAVFLGIGGLASTVREIQMLSFPVTILQMFMFGLATNAARDLDSPLGLFAQIFPLSSPYTMAARGATDPTLWPHLAALAWQGLWVAIIIALSAKAFRAGVLKSGGQGGGLLARLRG